jgi:peptidoglycan/LPS O-acetylase OafA/YrhL
MRRIFQKLRRDTNSLRYIPIVDGIRFIAIALVIFQHLNERIIKYNATANPVGNTEDLVSFLISRGTIGVFIFFALSGFIISLPFAAKKSFSPISYRQYLLRRLSRLEPPYIIWMTLFALVLGIRSQWPSDLWAHLLSSLTYTHNIVYTDFSIINPVAWSLEVEIQFYLVAPLIIVSYYKIPSFGRRSAFILLVIGVFMFVQHHLEWQFLPWRASILGQLQHFLVGIWIADIYSHTDFFRRKHFLWDLSGLISLAVMAFTWTEQLNTSIIFEASMILLFISFFKGFFLNYILSLPVITVIGGMCYTIYLIHLPLLEAISVSFYSLVLPEGYFLNLIGLSILMIPILGLISVPAYLYIEKPFMRKDWWKTIRFKNLFSNLSIQTK